MTIEIKKQPPLEVKQYKRISPDSYDITKEITIAIQWWPGSFNEKALQWFLSQEKLSNYKIIYSYTSEKVFEALYKNKVDFWFFALHNRVGLEVDETLEAMMIWHNVNLNKIARVDAVIRHTFMKHKDINIEKLQHIAAHPQVFLQCNNFLRNRYPELDHYSWEGNMIDTATLAEAVFQWKLWHEYAICGPSELATKYNFEIVEENIQDRWEDNITRFYLVERWRLSGWELLKDIFNYLSHDIFRYKR